MLGHAGGWQLAAIVLTMAIAVTPISAGDASDLASQEKEPLPPSSRTSSSFPLSFDSEIIRLAIVGDSVEVNGTYFLACQRPFAQPIPLFYPFPEDSLLMGARMIDGRLRIDGGQWRALQFEEIGGASGVRWVVPPSAGGTIEIQGRYRQGLREKYARYIVTTTRVWQQPLRHARFEIRLPAGATPIEFSFPFKAERDTARAADSAGASDSSAVLYVWETDSFYPDRDITVRWR